MPGILKSKQLLRCQLLATHTTYVPLLLHFYYKAKMVHIYLVSGNSVFVLLLMNGEKQTYILRVKLSKT